MSTSLRILRIALCLACAAPLSAGFAASESFLPDVGQVTGNGGARFYTTVWVSNLGSSTVDFTFEFLQSNQANLSPKSFIDSLAAGETKVYEDVVENNLKLSNVNGGARITASGDVLASERIYNQPSETPLSQTAGQFYSAVPGSFAVGSGETTSIQGVYLGSGKDFRYNFILLETSGHSCTVHVQARDDGGNSLGATDVPLSAFEQVLLPAGSLALHASSTNARISATVTSGSGTVILAGSQVANGGPQDQSGFEMSFKDSLLASGNSGAGVTSLNGLVGAVSLVPGDNITLTTEGNGIRIGGAAGGLTLPFSKATSSSTPAFEITNSTGTAIHGVAGGPAQIPGGSLTGFPAGVFAESNGGIGIVAASSAPGGGFPGVAIEAIANPGYGIVALSQGAVPTLLAENEANQNVELSTGQNAIAAGSGGDDPTILVENFSTGNGSAIAATSEGTDPTIAVENDSSTGDGVDVLTSGGVGVSIDSTAGGRSLEAKTSTYLDAAIFASNDGTGFAGWGVQGEYQNVSSGAPLNDGYLGGSDYGVYGVSAGQTGVYGRANGTGAGVYGTNTASGAFGELGAPSYGVYYSGGLGGTGTKNFLEPHPTDPTKEIRYVCLEGRESGTYFRGTGRIVNGFATIQVPDDFRMVTSEKGLTVIAMPMGDPAVLVCVKKSLDTIVLKGSSDVEFDYMVNGVRKAFPDWQPVSENRDFVPRSPADKRLTSGLPAENLQRLKASGILNEDGTINMETVRRLGWDQRPGWKNEESR